MDSTKYDPDDCGLGNSVCKNSDYSAKWVLDNSKSCKELSKNVWFGKKEASGQFIIFDLGCIRKIRKITIQNHHNKKDSWFQNIW